MEFVTVINRKKCKKIYKAIRKPIILFFLFTFVPKVYFCFVLLYGIVLSGQRLWYDKFYGYNYVIFHMVICNV